MSLAMMHFVPRIKVIALLTINKCAKYYATVAGIYFRVQQFHVLKILPVIISIGDIKMEPCLPGSVRMIISHGGDGSGTRGIITEMNYLKLIRKSK